MKVHLARLPLFADSSTLCGCVQRPGVVMSVVCDERLFMAVRAGERCGSCLRILIASAKEGGGNATRSEGPRPGPVAPGPPGVRPKGHGPEDGDMEGGVFPGWIV